MHSRPKQLTYGSLPWNDHPIDLAYGEQGWGPFAGPYTPLDYKDVAGSVGLAGISIGYNLAAFNSGDHGPGYHDITLFHDPSLDRVNATLSKLSNDSVKQPGQSYSNTISNGFMTSQSGATSSMSALTSKLKSALLGGE